jgi:hypothetical protein
MVIAARNVGKAQWIADKMKWSVVPRFNVYIQDYQKMNENKNHPREIQK